ncbi:TetR/AcrR family transcriptional regulator [Streptomyces sp. NPDC055239]
MSETQRRGRPRKTDTDRSILNAAEKLLLQDGYAGLSMEKVAAEAGVGKPTVYRRWSSKAALVGEVTRHSYLAAAPDSCVPTARPGEARSTISRWFRSHAQACTDSRSAALVLALTAAAAESPQDAESLYRHHTRDQHAAIADLLRTGVESGEFRADTDIDAVVDAMIGSALYLLLTGRSAQAPERAEGLLTVLMNGLAPLGLPRGKDAHR